MSTEPEDIDVLRTKCMMLGIDTFRVARVDPNGPPWVLIKPGEHHFRFDTQRIFYDTEREALEAGIKLAQAGAKYLDFDY